MDKINQGFETYMGESSGWVMENISSIHLNIARYKPIRGSSYTPTPAGLVGKHAIVDIRNEVSSTVYWIFCSLLKKDPII